MRVVNVAHTFRHKLHSLILYRVALGVGSNLLHLRRVLAKLLVVLLVGRASALLVACDESVNHRVGIAADRRCEVSVVVERQSEVTDIVYRILRLHHGAQRHGLYEVLLALTLARRHERVERLGECALRAVGLHLVAELHHELAQRLELCRVGVIVHTIRQRLRLLALCHLAYRFSHGAVGEEHELLDEFVGILRALEVATHRLALLVYVEVQLFAVELHGAVLEACSAQLLSQSVEHDERICVLTLVSALRRCRCRFARAVYHAVLLEQLLHLLVCVAAVRLDNGMHDAVRLHVSLLVEVEYYGER